jgi:RNA polymerase sigma-54 factor
MELGQALEQRLTVTPQLILANTLLQLSGTELEQVIAQELASNPALELIEVLRCVRCGQPLSDGRCPSCGESGLRDSGGSASGDVSGSVSRGASDDAVFREYSGGGLLFSAGDVAAYTDNAGDEKDAEVSRLTANEGLTDYLLRQVHLSLPTEDWPVAAYLVENLNDHGFLDCDLDEAASVCGVSRACVEQVLAALQGLDPVGIAARNARECLLIQLEHLRREGIEQPLARALVTDHWEALSRRSFAAIAEAEGTTVDQVQAALLFIRDNLNPFPAHAYWADVHEAPPEQEAAYPQPDVVISRSSSAGRAKYKVELPGAQVCQLRISDSYLEAVRRLREGDPALDEQEWEQWEAFCGRARLFIKSVEQRWRTLYELALRLVEYQQGYLAHGAKHLRPLTRAQLAAQMDVHESTVSRAVAGKYAQLPSGRIVPLTKFFDSAAPVKEIIRELIAREGKPLSDRQIAERLAEQGHRVSRRTVAKYRNALNILPSYLR